MIPVSNFNLLTLNPWAYWNMTVKTGLFQDSAGTTPVAADGDPVGFVRDLSRNRRHLLQTTDAKRPTFRSSIVGTRGACEFSAHFLQYIAESIPTIDMFIYAVARSTSVDSTNRGVVACFHGVNNNGSKVYQASNNSWRANTVPTSTIVSGGTVVSGDVVVLGYHAKSDTRQFRVDRRYGDQTVAGTSTAEPVRIGQFNNDDETNPFIGHIMEVALFAGGVNRSAFDRLMQFGMSRWG